MDGPRKGSGRQGHPVGATDRQDPLPVHVHTLHPQGGQGCQISSPSQPGQEVDTDSGAQHVGQPFGMTPA